MSFLLMQAGWFACVLGAGRGVPWLGPCVVLGLIGAHLRRIWRSPAQADWRERCGRELVVLLVVGAVGFFLESTFLVGHVLRYETRTLAPAWLYMLWPNFALATAEGGTLRGLAKRPWLGACLGAVFGPLAYRGGASFAPVALVEPLWRSLGILAAVWACVLPALFALRKRLRS
jgi:hypothetical protein